ncbi:MAG: lysine--tRNA ligase [Candidatus Bathyarchaeota archaeon]|nr:lysine--tRNA ligase [Candidatus Bathyarchaeota archaeon]
MDEIIGRGTWYDKIASEIVKREKELGRSLDNIRVESGVAASGIPHIGSLGEVTRNYAVSLALREQGQNSEFIVFSDNKDGLRSVPRGLPRSMEKYVGFPVTDVPDPFQCHGSYADHMVNLLLEALDKIGIEYRFMSAAEAYKGGLLNDEITLILEKAWRIGEIVKEETGQEKYMKVLPYFPVCASCGRIYTTVAYEFHPKERRVSYICEGMEVKGRWLEGCGYEGDAKYEKGEGKLSWKAGEFAARWRALKIRFEAYGKDLADSVAVNDRICREILGYEPPMHVQYELFLDKSGKKISKSVGNVLTPQVWFRYGSPQSLVLLTLKRFVGTRQISVTDIPRYMDELDQLEDLYFGRRKVEDQKESIKMRGLYWYCFLAKPPEKPSVHVPYNVLTCLARVAPKGSEKSFIIEKLRNYGYIREQFTQELETRINYALNWVQDFKEEPVISVDISPSEKKAVEELAKIIQEEDDAQKIQTAVFNVAKSNGIPPKRFFEILYLLLIGSPSGPRFGPYVLDIGKENAAKLLKSRLQEKS